MDKEKTTRQRLAEWSKTPEGRESYEKVAEEMRREISEDEELENEISKSIENLEGCSTKIDDNPEYHLINDENLREFARHFAQWGAARAKDESEKSVPNDAKEAAKEYARYHYADTFSQELAENDFIAGSAWKEMRMLKDAVEGEVDFEYFGYKVIRPDLKQLDTLLESMNHGDKVRIIIIKED